ncbi:MAG: hypothetical protein ACR2PA_05405 [Hyphomicrobiaceae bacterium]
MKHVTVIQHTQSEWLGLLEDHLEGRGIRFGYVRPFAAGVALPKVDVIGDGLIILGGGIWGSVSHPRLPTLEDEIRLARACLMLDIPVIGFDLGAQILSIAADGGADPTELSCRVTTALRTSDGVLDGFLPPAMPLVEYGRDRSVPPGYAKVLARDENDQVLIFQIGDQSFGFSGNPGTKLAMIEDLVMEFEECPADIQVRLGKIRDARKAMEDALVPLMTGLMRATRWMES